MEPDDPDIWQQHWQLEERKQEHHRLAMDPTYETAMYYEV